jgi:hypothetical protein
VTVRVAEVRAPAGAVGVELVRLLAGRIRVVGDPGILDAAEGETGGMIRVLVAEDMRILRDTLVAVLSLEDDIEVVGDVTDGAAIVPAVMARKADVTCAGRWPRAWPASCPRRPRPPIW